MPAPITDFAELIAKRTIVDPITGCHLWTGAKASTGYGILVINYKRYLAHRFVLEYTQNTSLTREQHVCHRCDTPACVNPSHLFIGTHADNMKDKVQKSRQYRPLSEACQGEKNSRAKLSQKDVRVIRELLAQGMSQKRIADQFDLNQSTISNIATKKRWGHL